MTDSNDILIDKLSKSYGKKLVIDDINLTIKSGQIFALVGLNGQGKTSLIKSILDLCSVDAGQIKIFDIIASDFRSRSSISYLPEKFSPAKDIKAIEFLKFNQELSSNKDLDLAAVAKLCQQLSLDYAMLDKRVTSYSKGMVQKLGLIASFISNSKLLIMDEPMSGLDPLARVNLKKVMQEYVADKNRTIIFTSHILSDIEQMCQDVAILHDGKIKYSGNIKDLMKNQKINFEEKFLQIIS